MEKTEQIKDFVVKLISHRMEGWRLTVTLGGDWYWTRKRRPPLVAISDCPDKDKVHVGKLPWTVSELEIIECLLETKR